MTEAAEIALMWLREMESCVRARDYERCRAIFATDVVGFGTKARIAVGLDALEHDQWRHIWGRIRNFTFEIDELHCASWADQVLWLGCPWSSEAPDGADGWRPRPGRITAVLERREGGWLAVHTHHSIVPEQTSLPRDAAEQESPS